MDLKEAMDHSVMKNQITEDSNQSKDWNSLLLLLLLTVPTGVMAIVLFLWPDVIWIAELPYTAIGILGAFAAILLSVFIMARYRDRPGVIYISAGLTGMAIINGIQSWLSPDSSEFVWLHALAGFFGSLFFSFYVLSRFKLFPLKFFESTILRPKSILVITVSIATGCAALLLIFSNHLPVMQLDGAFSNFAWFINSIPIILFLFSGVSMSILYRKTGSSELFLFTGIVIFLFQASEVFYLASLWSVIWWLWLTLRFVVYLGVLSYVLRGYIQTSSSLKDEIEERKQVEIALRTAEENWRHSFNSLEETMIIFNKEYKVMNINSSGLALLDKNKNEIIGVKCDEIMPCYDRCASNCLLDRVFTLSKTEHNEWYDERLNKHFAVTCTPVFSEEGQVSKCLYLIKDISLRVEAETKEKLLQQELNLTSRLASIGEVAAGITHEINNPLTSVIAFAQMLSQKEFPEDTKEAIDVINDGAERIANIVDKLLTFARRHKKGREYIDINDIINSIVEMRSYEMRNNNIEIILDLLPDLPRTMANIGELQQVFLNIVINAEQAILLSKYKEGKICIETGVIGDNIRINIIDDGPGIPEEYIEKLFDPFFTTKDENGGTGLGLSISYGIIKEHGGKIYAQSPEGQGATFVIELPIIKQESPDETSPSTSNRPGKTAISNILVVDDENHICVALDKLLSREGHNVETIRVAEKALRRVQQCEYDLILLDIKMPGIDGIEFYKRLGDIKPSLQQKVICITGDIISSRNKEFLDHTGIPFIAKPFGIDELVRLVNEVIGGTVRNEKIAYTYR
jgi:signal transduction histidine kinase/CheY-like chemotaxis protein